VGLLKLNILLLLFLYMGAAWCGGPPVSQCDHVDAGAIRWDAWHEDDSTVAQYIESSLGSQRWLERWPFFFTNLSGDLDFNETLAGVIPAENALAQGAGIDYWAFVFYGGASPMGRALSIYLQDNATKPKFALILSAGRMSESVAGESLIQEAVVLMRDKSYLRDATQSPIVFVMLTGSVEEKDWMARQIRAITSLKEKVKNAGDKSPNFVVMAFNPTYASLVADQVNTSLISSYASHGAQDGGSYQDLAQGAEGFWERQASTGKGVVPIVMTGWDPRPRSDKPPPWDKKPPIKEVHYQHGKPEQIAAHAGKAIEWAKQKPGGQCLILIYAWNEFDEGGWLAPTVGEGLSRLRALTDVLKINY